MSYKECSVTLDILARLSKLDTVVLNFNKGDTMKKFFSSRGDLLELIYEMGSFNSNELLARYRAITKSQDSDEGILDYINQLTKINILKNTNGKFVVQPFLRD